MYEFIDGFISIAGGAYAYLAAIGKVQIGNDKEKSKEWINKYGSVMKVLGPFLILFGIFRLFQAFVGQ